MNIWFLYNTPVFPSNFLRLHTALLSPFIKPIMCTKTNRPITPNIIKKHDVEMVEDFALSVRLARIPVMPRYAKGICQIRELYHLERLLNSDNSANKVFTLSEFDMSKPLSCY